MKIETRYLGRVDIEADKIMTFPSGLPGFSDKHDFVLLNFSKNDNFQVLQSIDDKDLAFIVTNPYQFYQDYEFKLDDSIRDTLDINKIEDVLVFSIVTLQETLSQSTINLKAPLILNRYSKLGKQYILNDDTYSMKQALVLEKRMQQRAKNDVSLD